MLCSFDVETSGLDPLKDRVLQLSCVKVVNDDIREKRMWYIKPDTDYEMSEVAAEKTGFTKEFINENGRSIRDICDEFFAFIEDCDLLAYNGSFDIHFLQVEFDRIGFDPHFERHRIIDAFRIERECNSHKLADVYNRLTGKELEGAHDAYEDANATIDVYFAQRREYGADTCDAITEENNRFLSTDGWLTKNDAGEVVFATGKYKEMPVKTVLMKDLPYIRWMCDKNVITLPTRKVLKDIMSTMK